MIHEFDSVDPHILEGVDLCIIGGGAAGIACAMEFAGTDRKIVLLEAGGLAHSDEAQDPYQSEVAGLPHVGVHDGRARIFGGTTTLWAGQVLPLAPIDFEARDWVPHSGWPISHAEVSKYYRRAEASLQLEEVSYKAEGWPASRPAPPAFNREICEAEFSQFSNHQNFAVSYRARLAAAENVHVVVHANVINIETEKDGQTVRQVWLRSLSGHRAKLSARYFVICCGGIETARLLLASNHAVSPNGLGNEHDVVGRYFQEHIHCKPLKIMLSDRRKLARLMNSFRQDGIKYQPKIAASEAFQRRKKILNVAAEIIYPPSEDSSIEAAKKLLRLARERDHWREIPRTALRVAHDPVALAKAVWRYTVLKQPAQDTSGAPYLGLGGEQAPNPDSRIRLSERKDALGMPRAVVDWRLTLQEKEGIEIFAREVSTELTRLGLGYIDLSSFPWPEDPSLFGKVLHDSNHHMGTTRMSDNPRTGVVDRNCRVHGVGNLFIASSSVFPTGGYSNPTMTILALTMRLSDHLKAQLAA